MPTTYRPIVRSFKVQYTREAIEHVRAGGHAVVWESESRAFLLFQKPLKTNPDDLGAWAVYDMGKSRWQSHVRGDLKGLCSSRIARDGLWIAKRRAERDSIHPGTTRKVDADCTKCAACCVDNEVLLQPQDIERFQQAGRPELAKSPYARRRRDGRVVLTLLPSKRCHHLRRNRTCGIYDLRPQPCREFPVGSESCLFAREQTLGVCDGAWPE